MSTNKKPGYRADMRTFRERLAAEEAFTTDTPFGVVQYADRGAGPPVLAVHGVMGGFDAGLRNIACDVPDGHRVIAPSRFGYLDSTMPNEATPAMQADVYAALLDNLGIDRVAVIGGSAGAPSCLQFAIRHPDRVTTLTLKSPMVPGSWYGPPSLMFKATAHALWRFNLVFWALERYWPRVVLDLMGVPADLPLTATDQATVRAELEGIFPIDERIDGILFDTFVSNPDVNSGYRFGDVTAPTLICHGEDDPGPPIEQARALAAQIPAARIVEWEHGGHLALGEHPEVQRAIHDMLRHTPTGPLLDTGSSTNP